MDVRRRLRSLDDDSRVLLVIVVDEREGVSDTDLTPGPLTRLKAAGMWMPVLDYQEGYGFTYGARVSVVDRLGPRSRVSVPLTWGGERQAALELERGFSSGPLARVTGGGGITRREHPFYDRPDTRRAIWGRVETAPRTWLRAGAGARRSAVTFGSLRDTLVTTGADVTVDTRRDPALPRNAVFLSAGIERTGFGAHAVLGADTATGSAAARLTSVDLRGYAGLLGRWCWACGCSRSRRRVPSRRMRAGAPWRRRVAARLRRGQSCERQPCGMVGRCTGAASPPRSRWRTRA
ncbi:MAG: hypothetical protein R2712_02875 [Vicinamibacterales bacterium]